ncbi:MAG: AI-2E family transporter [Desulfobacterales bacterium]|nr:AI-2E family transporter [Desulfobacterales bacterium]
MSALNGFSPVARGVIVTAALAVAVIFLQSAAAIIAPVLLSAFIVVILTPPISWLRRKRVPQWVSLPLIVFLLFEAGSLLGLVFTGQLEGFRDSLPGYRERLVMLRDQLGLWLEQAGVEMARDAVRDIVDPNIAVDLVRSAIANMRSTFGTGLLVLLSVVFMLFEAPGLQAKLRKAFHLTEAAENRLQRVFSAINHYMVIKSLASLATALCIGVWLWMLAIDYAVLWSILAFLLNFIPFIGAILMAVPALLVALVQADLKVALLVGLGYLVVNTVIGSILEPRIMGRGLGISTLAVFLSLLFWGWVLGTVGVFLAVPLTMALLIALDSSPHTRPLAILLGPEVTEPPAPRAEESAPGGAVAPAPSPPAPGTE